jgi:hypothetical protein
MDSVQKKDANKGSQQPKLDLSKYFGNEDNAKAANKVVNTLMAIDQTGGRHGSLSFDNTRIYKTADGQNCFQNFCKSQGRKPKDIPELQAYFNKNKGSYVGYPQPSPKKDAKDGITPSGKVKK